MNIFKLLSITTISLNLNYCSSFAENSSEFIENNSEFEETYSVVWDSEKNKANVKKTSRNLINDFVAKLTDGNLIHQAYLKYIHLSKNNRRSSTPNGSQSHQFLPQKPASIQKHNVEQFKKILEEEIKEYFSSKEITYNETGVKDFVNQLFIPQIPTMNNSTVKMLIDKIKNKKDPILSKYLSKIFQSEK